MIFLFPEMKFRKPEGDELQGNTPLQALTDVAKPPLQIPQDFSSSLFISSWHPTNPFRQLLHLDTKA